METKQFFVMVRTKDEPGAGVYQAIVHADNVYNATQQAKAMFGNLLLSESAIPVNNG
jgi:hypothetical protein